MHIMKPEQEANSEDADNPASVSGDAIGNTAYSERFVLRILLKLANTDTLKEEIVEKSFEEDLCVLWDMTAERDVVAFLQKHKVLSLFNFALPVIESPRIIEIIIGIIGNMCCQKDVVANLLGIDNFLSILLEYMKTDDSLVLIQLLRLVSACLYDADDENIAIWLTEFTKVEYSSTLYYILNNSSHKDLLVTALENLNTICSYCNEEKSRTTFFDNFVTSEAIHSLSAAFVEVTVTNREVCNKEELERIFAITIQIVLNLIGFDKSPEIYCDSKDGFVTLINQVLVYFENKFVVQKEIDSDLVDIIDSTNTIIKVLQLSEVSELESFFNPAHNILKSIQIMSKSCQNGSSSFEEEDKEELEDISVRIISPLSTLICNYIAKCTDENLTKVMNVINTDYEYIIAVINDKVLKTIVKQRVDEYRTKVRDNVDL